MVLKTGCYVTVFGLSYTVTTRYTRERDELHPYRPVPLCIGLYPIHGPVHNCYVKLFFYEKLFLKIHDCCLYPILVT